MAILHNNRISKNGVVSIGKFDGMHLGHAEIVRRVRNLAAELNAPAVIISFDPLPRFVLHPETAAPLLCSHEHKAQLIGIDAFYELKTTPELLALPAEEFFDSILLRQIGAKAIVEGHSFSFGADRSGNISLLKELCKKNAIILDVPSALSIDGEIVSSSLIRKYLLDGNVKRASRLLGRPYSIDGTVICGDKRGRKMGFPTANIRNIQTLIPKHGIYATTACFDGKRLPSATCIGNNPSFGGNELRIETFILDFDGDLYGETMCIEFCDWIRENRRFETESELVEQIRKDVLFVRSLHEKSNF